MHLPSPPDEPTIVPQPLASERIDDIARRAVWNPANVNAAEIQLLAASVLAHVAARVLAADAPVPAAPDGAMDGDGRSGD